METATIQEKIDHLGKLRLDVGRSLTKMRDLNEKIKTGEANAIKNLKAQHEQMITARDRRIANLHEVNQELKKTLSNRTERQARHEALMEKRRRQKREREITEGLLHKRPTFDQWISVWENWEASKLKQKLPYLQHVDSIAIDSK